MKTEETLSARSLRELASAAGPCITIVAGQEPGRFPDLIDQVRGELLARKIDPKPLLAPVLELDPEFAANDKRRGTTVILRAPEAFMILQGGASMKPSATVADRFNVRSLLAVTAGARSFFIIALSQKRTRVIECTEHSSQEIALAEGTPVSLADAMQTRQPDHVLDNHSSGGPSMGSTKGVMFGTSTDRENKDEYLLHYFIQIDKAVNNLLKGRSEWLIPVGVEQEIALYRTVNTYPWLVAPGVHGSPDGLEGGEMHQRALALLDSQALELRPEFLADFDKKIGTGHASTHMQEIVAAAWEGRISHLLMQKNAQYSGSFDPVRGIVKHANGDPGEATDLIESAALQTLLHGGDVQILPGSAMPNGVPVCAILRYAPVVTPSHADSASTQPAG